MNALKSHSLFKVVSVILVITFLNLDIAWSYPDVSSLIADPHKVAAPGMFQPAQNLPEHIRNFQQAMYGDVKLATSVFNIAKYLFGEASTGEGRLRLNTLEAVLGEELKGYLEGIDLSCIVSVTEVSKDGEVAPQEEKLEDGFVSRDAMVLIPYKRGDEKFIIQIAPKDSPAVKEMIGYRWDIAEDYVMAVIPEKFSAGVAAQEAEKPRIVPSDVPAEVEIEDIKVSEEGKTSRTKRIISLRSILPMILLMLTTLFLSSCGKESEEKGAKPGDNKPAAAAKADLDIGSLPQPETEEQKKEIEGLLDKLEYDDIDISSNAQKRLGEIGKPAVGPLVKMIANTSRTNSHRRRAMVALGKTGAEEAVKPLIKIMENEKEDITVRGGAAIALGNLHKKEAVPALIKIIENEKNSQRFRESTARSLAQIGDPRGLKPIRDAGFDRWAKELEQKIKIEEEFKVLADSGTEKEIEGLIKKLSDTTYIKIDHAPVADKAKVRLAEIGAPAIGPLLEVVKSSKDKYLRTNAILIIGRTGAEEAVKPLIGMVEDENEDMARIRSVAAKSLGNFPGHKEEIIPVLLKVLNNKENSKWFREDAAKSLVGMGDPRVIDPLNKAGFRKEAKELKEKTKDQPHDFTAQNGYNAGLAAWTLAALAIGAFSHLYTVDPDAVSALVSLAAVGLYFAWAGMRYCLAGGEISEALTRYHESISRGAYPIPSDGVLMHTPIARSDGYRHPAFRHLPASVQKWVLIHESFKSHLAGTLGMLPVVSAMVSEGPVHLAGESFSMDGSKKKEDTASPAAASPIPESSASASAPAEKPEDTAEIFRFVEDYVNNSRAKLIRDGNVIAAFLKEHDPDNVKYADSDMATEELGAHLEHMVKVVDEVLELKAKGRTVDVELPDAVIKASEDIKKNIITLETDALIAGLILMARRADREGQNLIIGLETGWVPGYEKGTLQHNALNPLMREIQSVGETLEKIGLRNITIVNGTDAGIAADVMDEATRTDTGLKNVVVLGSKAVIESDAFDLLRSTGNEEKAFLAAVDPTALMRFYLDNGELSDRQLDIEIVEMLVTALELASGKVSQDLPAMVHYDQALRMVVFLPKAKPVELDRLKEIYAAKRMALQAA